jgi:tRNA pseudouridine38-40 synthase
VDLQAMRQAARCLVGRHDFASFATNPGYVRKRGTVRTLQRTHLVARPWGFDLAVQGDGFLYNMVRAIAGTLLDVGLRRYRPERVAEILQARDRRTAGATAPACGLYLVRVLYPRALLPMRT